MRSVTLWNNWRLHERMSQILLTRQPILLPRMLRRMSDPLSTRMNHVGIVRSRFRTTWMIERS